MTMYLHNGLVFDLSTRFKIIASSMLSFFKTLAKNYLYGACFPENASTHFFVVEEVVSGSDLLDGYCCILGLEDLNMCGLTE